MPIRVVASLACALAACSPSVNQAYKSSIDKQTASIEERDESHGPPEGVWLSS